MKRRDELGLARNGPPSMSGLSPLTGVKRKSNFGAVKSAFDPERTFPPIIRSLVDENRDLE
jgi:hypothetical protein